MLSRLVNPALESHNKGQVSLFKMRNPIFHIFSARRCKISISLREYRFPYIITGRYRFLSSPVSFESEFEDRGRAILFSDSSLRSNLLLPRNGCVCTYMYDKRAVLYDVPLHDCRATNLCECTLSRAPNARVGNNDFYRDSTLCIVTHAFRSRSCGS